MKANKDLLKHKLDLINKDLFKLFLHIFFKYYLFIYLISILN